MLSLKLRSYARVLLRGVILSCVLVLPDQASGELPDYSGYRVMDTAFTRIFFPENNALLRFNRNLKLGRVDQLINWGALKSTDPSHAVAAKVDALFRRVEDILDMRPEGMRTTLMIASDRQEFRRIYRKMYRSETELIAFFSPARNVIVIDATEVTANVLAHEMAHAVIHAYYGNASTPGKVHEILAQYVDLHLHD